MRRGLLALLLLGVVVAAPPVAGDDSGTVTGRLLFLDGPVTDARVVVRSSAHSDYEGSGTTDADGEFTIAGVPLGDVEVLVYLATGDLAARGEGVLDEPGEVVHIPLGPPP
jgi:hypothetical protein